MSCCVAFKLSCWAPAVLLIVCFAVLLYCFSTLLMPCCHHVKPTPSGHGHLGLPRAMVTWDSRGPWSPGTPGPWSPGTPAGRGPLGPPRAVVPWDPRGPWSPGTPAGRGPLGPPRAVVPWDPRGPWSPGTPVGRGPLGPPRAVVPNHRGPWSPVVQYLVSAQTPPGKHCILLELCISFFHRRVYNAAR